MNFKYIDISMLENLYDDRPDRLKEIAGKYSENISLLLEKLQTALKNQDQSAQRNAAHSLKTAFKYLGMEDQSETALKIEKMAESEQGDIHKPVEEILSVWEKAKAEVENFVKK